MDTMYMLTEPGMFYRSDEGVFAGAEMSDLELVELGSRVIDSIYEENVR